MDLQNGIPVDGVGANAPIIPPKKDVKYQ